MTVAIKPIIYQLVVRYFSNTNPTNQRDGTLAVNGCGRFNEIDARALAEVHALGATHLWLTGCLRQATLTDYSDFGMPADLPDVVKGLAGSMYAVRDYFDVCPDYASSPEHRLAEFEALVQRAHTAGLKTLLDLVPNHVARGYHSVVEPGLDFGTGDDQSQPYARDNHFHYLPGTQLTLPRPSTWSPPGVVFTGRYPPEDGSPGHTPKVTGDNCVSPTPPPSSWYETIKLNYGYDLRTERTDYDPPPRTWELMDRILAYWQARGIDGFRCDMAHMVPLPAWRHLIGRARQRDPGCFFLAEAYPGGGPGIPVADLDDLIAAGFDAFYHSDSYNALKQVYQGRGTLDSYDRSITSLSAAQRRGRLQYLENHDERRLPSPVVPDRWAGDSGFGSAEAGHQLAPLQYLASDGPVLLYQGQEVGERGDGHEGFSTADGRSTTFDYASLPGLSCWVNGHAYDGGRLSPEQQGLRRWYATLLALCQSASVRGSGYWGLRYHQREMDLHSFARFVDGSGVMLVVAANFRPNAELHTVIRIPEALADQVGLAAEVTVRLVLDRSGKRDEVVARTGRRGLIAAGFALVLPNQTAQVYQVGG